MLTTSSLATSVHVGAASRASSAPGPLRPIRDTQGWEAPPKPTSRRPSIWMSPSVTGLCQACARTAGTLSPRSLPLGLTWYRRSRARHAPISTLDFHAEYLDTAHKHRVVSIVAVALALVGAGGVTFAIARTHPTLPSHKVGASPTLPRPQTSAGSGQQISCVDLPVSSAVVSPKSCWVTGPTSGLIVGSNPSQTNEAVIVIIRGGAQSLVRLPDAGNLRVTAVNEASACVMDILGKYRAVNLEAGTVTPSWGGACSLSDASGKARSSPAVTAPAAGRVVGRLLADTSSLVPSVTPSYYEYESYYSKCDYTPNPSCPLYEQGASALSPASDGLVVLDFGSPCYDPSNTSVYGVEMFFVATCIPDTSLVPLVQNWISGYESQNGSGTPNLTVALGTSNSLNGVDTGAGGALTNSQLQAAGVDWYTSLVAAVPTAGLHAPVTLWGASDMEQSSDGDWYGGTATEAFVDGFSSASPADGACVQNQAGYLVDYGDDVLGGNGSGDGWTVQQVYAVAWGIQVSCALPEIYYTDMASEWEALSRWGPANGGSTIAFSGVMTEIESGSLDPDDAWDTLESDTQQSPSIPSVTTISWTLQNLPQISSVTPDQGPLLGGTQVNISGSNLSGTEAVYFGDNPATSFTVLGATALTAITPAASGGSVSVTVATAVGTSSPDLSAFTYSNGPCTSAGLSASPTSVTAGTSVSVKASVACATGSVAAFVYWVQAPGSTTWVNQTPWTGPTWALTRRGWLPAHTA